MLIRDRDAVSLCSSIGQDVRPNRPGVPERDCQPACDRGLPVSLVGGERLEEFAAGCGTPRACAVEPLCCLGVATGATGSNGDGTRRAILEVSPDAARLELIRADRRGVGSIDLRCWREADDRVICASEAQKAFVCTDAGALMLSFASELLMWRDGEKEGYVRLLSTELLIASVGLYAGEATGRMYARGSG